MSKQEAFDKKLGEVLKKYEKVVKESDQEFLQNYISHCLTTETVVSPKKYTVSPKSKFDYVSDKIFKTLIIIFLIIGTSIVVKDAAYKRLDKLFTQPGGDHIINSYLFAARRFAVFFGIPNWSFIKGYYDGNCLVSNPFFERELNCQCSFVLKQYHLTDLEKAQRNFMARTGDNGTNNPFVVLNGLDYPVSFQDVKTVVKQQLSDLKQGHNFVEKLHGSSIGNNFENIFAGDEPPENSLVAWSTMNVNAARHLRPLFPRPKFVHSSLEISLNRKVIFFGKSVKGLLPVAVNVHEGSPSFYIQAWGDGNYILKSPKACRCKKGARVIIKLKAGQILYFNNNVHELYAAVESKEKSYSMGYLGVLNRL